MIRFRRVMGKNQSFVHWFDIGLTAFSLRTPEKIFYSKLRTAFNASFSRTNEHDLQFGSLMDHDQPTSKQPLSPQIDFDNDAVPDDFILVEVVRSNERKENARRSSRCFLTFSETLFW